MDAIILAGGRGERLRPLTDDRPKVLVEVAGKTLLEHQLSWLKSNGISKATLAVGYLWEAIESKFGGGWNGVSLMYSLESSPLGRGGAIRQAMGKSKADLFVVMNGDVLFHLWLELVVASHKRWNTMATVVTTPLISPFGVVEFDKHLVTSFLEKPKLPYQINAGIYVMSREILPLLPEQGDHEDTTFPELAKARKLGIYQMSGFWKSIENFKDLTEAEKAFR